jgi:hypothetical protein
MNQDNGTGVEYPKITLGGVEYEVKFTRAVMYRMGKLGIKFEPTIKPDRVTVANFSQLVDVLHLAISFQGTPEQLAELCFDQRHEIVGPLVSAWLKVVLPSMPTIQTPAANPTPDRPLTN